MSSRSNLGCCGTVRPYRPGTTDHSQQTEQPYGPQRELHEFEAADQNRLCTEHGDMLPTYGRQAPAEDLFQCRVKDNGGKSYPNHEVHCACENLPQHYFCKNVYTKKCLMDCPDQDGPPADCYTFL